jgi:hypothetical protein
MSSVMKFLDEAKIYVRAGDGGAGAVSFNLVDQMAATAAKAATCGWKPPMI